MLNNNQITFILGDVSESENLQKANRRTGY